MVHIFPMDDVVDEETVPDTGVEVETVLPEITIEDISIALVSICQRCESGMTLFECTRRDAELLRTVFRIFMNRTSDWGRITQALAASEGESQPKRPRTGDYPAEQDPRGQQRAKGETPILWTFW